MPWLCRWYIKYLGQRNRRVFLDFPSIDISNVLTSMVTIFTLKINRKHFINNQRKTIVPNPWRIRPPPIVPPPQNRKRGVDASFSFILGLCLLMRRLSFTFKKKSFLVLSLPITSKSVRSPWWLVCVICSCTAVGFVLLIDGWRVRGVNFKCSHQRTVWCRSVLSIYKLLQVRHV